MELCHRRGKGARCGHFGRWPTPIFLAHLNDHGQRFQENVTSSKVVRSYLTLSSSAWFTSLDRPLNSMFVLGDWCRACKQYGALEQCKCNYILYAGDA